MVTYHRDEIRASSGMVEPIAFDGPPYMMVQFKQRMSNVDIFFARKSKKKSLQVVYACICNNLQLNFVTSSFLLAALVLAIHQIDSRMK